MNFQSCARQVFVGLGDSYLFYYQAIRRSWRFGQRRPVNVHIVLTEPEAVIYHNVLRKEREAQQMSNELIANVAEYERAEVQATVRESMPYATNDATGRDWRLLLGDSAERLRELPDGSVDLAVYSPPFADLFVYSASERDLGNSRTPEQFWEHYGFIIREMYRLTKPGRTNCVHVADVPSMKERDGHIGLKDFPGATIRAYEAAGWVFYSRITIKRNPQIQAMRTHSHGLSFLSLRRDSGDSRVAISDYILVFHKPGERVERVHSDITNDLWIEWASNIWEGIREGHTLNAAEARDPDDVKHICPLQLDTIERCVRLWSNPGETVLSPFAGIGSEGVVSLEHGRRFIGIELNGNYWRTACRNLQRAEALVHRPSLFDAIEAAS
jgi:DNA modification methylase